ncbi:hypothetical protein H5410_031121 [Solanum commersonii]|uniref:Uncharacterized protein n=1 Tax=Solanum commersonii TaxID=4109 RepID=A0A9J5YIZ8_SOLCO|nr:hypothetical protein H5410_031121 [Solanum commersonii]
MSEVWWLSMLWEAINNIHQLLIYIPPQFFKRLCFVTSVSMSLIFAETVVVSFYVNLSVWTLMGTITLDVKQH